MSTSADNPASKGTPDLEGDINALLGEMEQSTQRLANASASDGTAGAVVVPLAAPSSHGSVPQALDAIENLDAQLAELTAQLLDGKGRAEDMAPPQEPVATPPTPVLVAPPAPPAPAAPAPAPEPTPPVARPVVAAPAPVVAVPAERPVEVAASGPAAPLRLLAAVSSPLESRSPVVRAAVGILALNTLLIGGVVWGYLVFRPPPQHEERREFDLGADALPQPRVEEPAKPAHEAKGAEHGEGAKEGHTAKKPDPKKAAKKPPAKKAAKKPAEQGEEGEHSEH